MKVIYPGTFDPPHLGHFDIVKKASSLFEEVLIAIANNPKKKPLFTVEERVFMFKEMTKDFKNVVVKSFDTMLVDFAKKEKAKAIIRGVRLFTDFEYELQIALTNRHLGSIETIFMMPSQEYIHISSTIIRDIIFHKGDISSFVSPCVYDIISKKL